MQLTNIITLLALSASAIAAPAPAPAEAKDMMVAATSWTVKSFKRVCNTANTSCTYTYSIDTHAAGSKPAVCSYKVTGTTASQKGYQNVKCGDFTIGSSWSDQFGAAHGFQTLSAVKAKQIIYPSYTDVQLKGGKVVSPDQSYTPQNLS